MKFMLKMYFFKPPYLHTTITAKNAGEARNLGIQEALRGGFGYPKRVTVVEVGPA